MSLQESLRGLRARTGHRGGLAGRGVEASNQQVDGDSVLGRRRLGASGVTSARRHICDGDRDAFLQGERTPGTGDAREAQVRKGREGQPGGLGTPTVPCFRF